MTTAALVIALIGSSITVAQNGVSLYIEIKSATITVAKVPVKTGKFVYKKALKPVGKAIKG